MKIAAVIVLYNPDENVIKNIKSYSDSVDELIVVDNTIQNNFNSNYFIIINNIKNSVTNLNYIQNSTNLGIATALNLGCQRAISLECEWILTMDQDSRFINFIDYIKCLNKIKNNTNISIIAPNSLRNAKQYLPEKVSCIEEEKTLVITSGNFINLDIYQKVKGFEDKLFIDMVDYEYCLKVISNGYKILFFKDILLNHSVGNLCERKNLISRQVRLKIEHSPQRVYYGTRNSLYMWKKYGRAFPKEFNFIKTVNILFVHEITKIILYEDSKVKKIYAKFIALYHFLLNKYGRYELFKAKKSSIQDK